MAMVENVELKGASMMHACKICKKRFRCGGALGGHMRSHSLGDVNACISNDDLQDKPGGNKKTYFLRTTTNRFVGSYRARENCGKKFLTLNTSNIGDDRHGTCHALDERVMTSMSFAAPGLRGSTRMENENGSSSSEEEEDLANCLVMLSNGKLDPMSEDAIKNSLSLGVKEVEEKSNEVVKGMFQCKACKKVFSSHQALGGHRASHKKVKGCFASKFDNLEDDRVEDIDKITSSNTAQPGSSPPFDLNHASNGTPFDHHNMTSYSRKKPKVHECSICHRVFSSGQALGGHKRCHWLSSQLPDTCSIPNFHDQFQYDHDSQQLYKKPVFKQSEPLDLNLPALADDTAEARLNNDNTSNFEAPTRNFLQARSNEGVYEVRTHHQNTTNNMLASLYDVHDHEHRKIKMVKLSDMHLDGGSSTWLQMGFNSTSDGGEVI